MAAAINEKIKLTARENVTYILLERLSLSIAVTKQTPLALLKRT